LPRPGKPETGTFSVCRQFEKEESRVSGRVIYDAVYGPGCIIRGKG
jgi:hypothetical protein